MKHYNDRQCSICGQFLSDVERKDAWTCRCGHIIHADCVGYGVDDEPDSGLMCNMCNHWEDEENGNERD